MNKETRTNILKYQDLINNNCNCFNCHNSELSIENNKLRIICKIHDAYVSDETPCLDYENN